MSWSSLMKQKGDKLCTYVAPSTESSRRVAAAGQRLFLHDIKHTRSEAPKSRRTSKAGAREREADRWRVARGRVTHFYMRCFTECPTGAQGSSSNFVCTSDSNWEVEYFSSPLFTATSNNLKQSSIGLVQFLEKQPRIVFCLEQENLLFDLSPF